MSSHEHYKLSQKLNEGKPAFAALYEAKFDIKESILNGERLKSEDINQKFQEKGFFNIGNNKFQYFEKPGVEPKFDSSELKKEVNNIYLQKDQYEKIKNIEIPKEPGFLTKLINKEGAKATEKQIQLIKNQKEELPEIFIPDFTKFDKIQHLEYPKRTEQKENTFVIKPKEVEIAFGRAVDKSIQENGFTDRKDGRTDVLKHPIKLFNEVVGGQGISRLSQEANKVIVEAINQNIVASVVKDVEKEKQYAEKALRKIFER